MIRIRFNRLLTIAIILPLLLITIPLSTQNKTKISIIEFIKGPIKFINYLCPKSSLTRRQTMPTGPRLPSTSPRGKRREASRQAKPQREPAKQICANNLYTLPEEVLSENNRLKTLLDFKKKLSYVTVACRVIGRDPSNWANTIIVDKGIRDGIKIDSPVLYVDGLVGRVIELGESISKVILITDFNSRVVALVERTRQVGVVYGMNKNICKLKYIPLDSDIKVGDKIVSSGLGGVYPKGLLVGEVISVGKESDRLSLYAIVRPSQYLDKLEEVFVIKR